MTEIPAAATDSPRIPWEDQAVGAVSGLFRTIGMVISRPGEAFGRVANGSGLGRPFAFGIVVGYVAIVVALLWNAVTQAFVMRVLARFAPEMRSQLEQGQAVSDATLTLILAVAGPFIVALTILIGAGLFHLFLMLFGGATRPFADTVRVVAYAQACQVFALIPLCGGLVASVWGIVVEIIGLNAVHRCGAGKASASVLVPLLVCCVCGITVYVFVFAAALSMAK